MATKSWHLPRDTVGRPAQSPPSSRASKPRRAPRLRPASFEDHEQIDRLGSRFGLKAKGYEEWSHLWLGNPTYRAVQDRWSIGWVLEDEHGRIVGSVGNIPVSYELEGRTILATSSHAWVAEPEYRSAALLLLDHLINQRGVDLFLTTTNSAASTPGVEAFQCRRVPVGIWDESAFWITHYRGFLGSYLAFRGYPLASLVRYPLSVVLFLRDQLRRRRDQLRQRARSAEEIDIQACPAFDSRFDDFWLELRRRNRHLLLAVRTREVLEWHYRYLMSSDGLWIGTVVEGSRILAYAVFDRSDRRGLKRIRLVDFQALDGTPALLLPLLTWALDKCRTEEIHVLEYFGRWLENGEILDAVAPYRRRLPAWIFVYRANDPELAEQLKGPRAWAPTLYDGDASLVR